MAARVYRIEGREVSQREYLDFQARKAGYPGGRKERQRAQSRAKKEGRKLTPAEGGRKPSVGPGKAAWRPISATGRSLTTRPTARAAEALRGAARRGSDVFISVVADSVTYSYDRGTRATNQAATGRIDAETVAGFIRDAGGDVQQGLKNLLESTPEYQEVGDIQQVTIREYRQ